MGGMVKMDGKYSLNILLNSAILLELGYLASIVKVLEHVFFVYRELLIHGMHLHVFLKNKVEFPFKRCLQLPGPWTSCMINFCSIHSLLCLSKPRHFTTCCKEGVLVIQFSFGRFRSCSILRTLSYCLSRFWHMHKGQLWKEWPSFVIYTKEQN